jgi:hypothetical protein
MMGVGMTSNNDIRLTIFERCIFSMFFVSFVGILATLIWIQVSFRR